MYNNLTDAEKLKKKEKEMSYSVAVSSSGQITLPAALRKALGIGKRVTVDRRGKEIIVEREPTIEEVLDEINEDRLAYEAEHPDVAARAKKYAGMTVKEMMEVWEQTPEGRKYLEEQYDD